MYRVAYICQTMLMPRPAQRAQAGAGTNPVGEVQRQGHQEAQDRARVSHLGGHRHAEGEDVSAGGGAGPARPEAAQDPARGQVVEHAQGDEPGLEGSLPVAAGGAEGCVEGEGPKVAIGPGDHPGLG